MEPATVWLCASLGLKFDKREAMPSTPYSAHHDPLLGRPNGYTEALAAIGLRRELVVLTKRIDLECRDLTEVSVVDSS